MVSGLGRWCMECWEKGGDVLSQLIPIKLIKQSSSLQPRANMSTAIIDEYTDSMKAGASFPPVVVFQIGEDLYLVDGYHRFLAVQGAKFDKILADVRTGTMREAVLYSAGVNATHGIRRTNDDKRRAVLILLRDKEWGGWADTKIASTCNVSSELVGKIRKSILPISASATPEKRKVERAGKVIKMDTSKIGKKHEASEKLPDPTKVAFCYQPGELGPASDLPPQSSLAERVRAQELQEASANQQAATIPAPLPDAQPVTPCLPTSAPCLAGYRCPEGGEVILPEKNSIHGKRCSVNMQEIFQKSGKSALFRDECPLLVAAAKKLNPPAVEAFQTANHLAGVKILHERGPLKIVHGPMEILWKPSPKMQSFLERVMKSQGLDTPSEALDEIVSRAMEAEA